MDYLGHHIKQRTRNTNIIIGNTFVINQYSFEEAQQKINVWVTNKTQCVIKEIQKYKCGSLSKLKTQQKSHFISARKTRYTIHNHE